MEQPVERTPRPSMLTADEVAERLKIKKGSAYEVIRQMNKEQEVLGRVVIREHTWLTKENIIQGKLIPFFGDMRMCDIRPVDIVRWQNSLTGSTRPDGDVFKLTNLRIINSRLNAIFNHAERY